MRHAHQRRHAAGVCAFAHAGRAEEDPGQAAAARSHLSTLPLQLGGQREHLRGRWRLGGGARLAGEAARQGGDGGNAQAAQRLHVARRLASNDRSGALGRKAPADADFRSLDASVWEREARCSRDGPAACVIARARLEAV